MAVSFFLPKKINVGFQNRSDTYTKKLAYIIYYDEKGKLRKETSWNGWRDKNIDNEIYDNEPTTGFVLNKKAGGYSTGWNHRQTYVRVFDPRGFEFEITVPNLLYILENATSTKGKGLEGEFVYGWDGKDLVLIPTDSPDYQELVKLNALRHTKEFIKAKELKIGATYRTKQNDEYVYMGKFDEYNYYGNKLPKQQFYFYQRGKEYTPFVTMASISQKLVEVISDECVEDYAEIFTLLETKSNYSPIDKKADEYVDYTLEEFLNCFQYRWKYVYSNAFGEMTRTQVSNSDKPYFYKRQLVEREYGYGWNKRKESRMEEVATYAESLEDIFVVLKPKYKRTYLANGKLHSEEK